MDVLEIEIYKRYQSLIDNDYSCKESFNKAPKKIHLADVVELYDAFCFDGYGTLYNRGDFVYPSAREWYTMLRRAGKQLRLVTNAASNVDAVLAADAAARGFTFSAAETISSGSLLRDFVEKRGTEVWKNPSRELYYIGRPSGVNVLSESGIKAVENPKDPVVAVSSNIVTGETFAHAVDILNRPGAVLLVLNSDAWAPKIDGTRTPVSGDLSERLRRESGCRVHYFGKPFPEIWQKVRQTLSEGARVLMIGDTLGTDVYGAYVAGFDSALVVGRNEPESELGADERLLGLKPTYYLVP